jgi:hypothetical protein
MGEGHLNSTLYFRFSFRGTSKNGYKTNIIIPAYFIQFGYKNWAVVVNIEVALKVITKLSIFIRTDIAVKCVIWCTAIQFCAFVSWPDNQVFENRATLFSLQLQIAPYIAHHQRSSICIKVHLYYCQYYNYALF